MAEEGHEGKAPLPRLSDRCPLREPTLAASSSDANAPFGEQPFASFQVAGGNLGQHGKLSFTEPPRLISAAEGLRSHPLESAAIPFRPHLRRRLRKRCFPLT